MSYAQLLSVEPLRNTGGERVNIFVHGYRAITTDRQIEEAKTLIAATGATGENYLLNWSAGRWRDSGLVAGLRVAYRVARFRKILSPWMLLVDAGVVTLAEVAQFKFMERRAEQVGRELPRLLTEVAQGRPINLIGHSLGARVIHHSLADDQLSDLTIEDCVLLAGAADLEAENWSDCLSRIRGRLYNAYSPHDRILKITPDLRRRVGGHEMPQIVLDGEERVVNHRFDRLKHVEYWTKLDRILPKVWTNCHASPVNAP